MHMLNYCRALKFEDDPDYHLLYGFIFSLCEQKKFELDFRFPWIEKNIKTLVETSKILGYDKSGM